MARTGIAVAPNAVVTQVVQYLPDPRGWRMFTSLSAVWQRGISGHTGVREVPRYADFQGALPTTLQPFEGMAYAGRTDPVVAKSATMSQERSGGSLTDAGLRIFAQRLARGK